MRRTSDPFISVLLRLVIVAGLLLVLVRCDWGSASTEGHSFVVEAFLETGEPLPPVTLRETSPLRAPPDSLPNPASGGEVVIELSDEVFVYEESGTPGKYVPRSQDTVPSQAPWRLIARWNGETATASGETPSPINIREVCVDFPSTPSQAVQVDSLRRDSLDIPADLGYLYPMDVTVRWSDDVTSVDPNPGVWVRAQLSPDATPFPSEVVEFFLQPAETRLEDEYPETGRFREWQGVYAVPVDSADTPLPRHNLTTALVRGDTSFAAFAQTRTDPNRREPISNVDGGLGIAIAVSVDSLVRTIDSGVSRCRVTE